MVSKLTLSSQGHVVVSGHSREVHTLHGYFDCGIGKQYVEKLRIL